MRARPTVEHSAQYSSEEATQVTGDDVQVALQQEVAAVDQVHLRVLGVAGSRNVNELVG
jgi:hypothetical protein